jgi:hypothetical protein
MSTVRIERVHALQEHCYAKTKGELVVADAHRDNALGRPRALRSGGNPRRCPARAAGADHEVEGLELERSHLEGGLAHGFDVSEGAEGVRAAFGNDVRVRARSSEFVGRRPHHLVATVVVFG